MNKSERWAKRRVKCWEVTFEADGKEMRYVEMGVSREEAAGRAAIRFDRRYGNNFRFVSVKEIAA